MYYDLSERKSCKSLVIWYFICKFAEDILFLCMMTTDLIKSTVSDYFKTQPVLKAWLFGSYSRGEQTKDSDVDILVQYDRSQRIGLLKIAGMHIDLENLLGHKVDIVEDGTLRPWSVESVNKDKCLIYERAW